MARKVCNHCGVEKDEAEFSWRYKAPGIRNPACRDCHHAFNKDSYEGDAKERHLQQVKKEQKQPVKLHANMYTSIYLAILLKSAARQIPVCWNFTVSEQKIWRLQEW